MLSVGVSFSLQRFLTLNSHPLLLLFSSLLLLFAQAFFFLLLPAASSDDGGVGSQGGGCAGGEETPVVAGIRGFGFGVERIRSSSSAEESC